MKALISVSDKTGIVEFAKELEELGIEIISTGGTYKKLKEEGVKAIEISDLTGFPECLDGRVKTLHPKVHAGILAMRSNPKHMEQLKQLNVDTIDFVVVNLYPFKQTILKEGVTRQEAVENIDIGGPTMLRSAAKNYQDVTVITDPKDYEKVLTELKENGRVSLDTKFYLMNKVFEHTASYDAMICNYLKQERKDESLPQELTLTYEKVQEMRYGENPHQIGALYKEIGKCEGSLTIAKQLNGKELSFNNINDTNGALELLKEFKENKEYVHMALAVDEFGSVEGLITLNDLLEGIVGDIPGIDETDDPMATQRLDGTWLIDGRFQIDKFKELFDYEKEFPYEKEDQYTTIAGFILSLSGKIPDEKEIYDWDRFHFEILDIDGHQIDKILVTDLGPQEEETEEVEE